MIDKKAVIEAIVEVTFETLNSSEVQRNAMPKMVNVAEELGLTESEFEAKKDAFALMVAKATFNALTGRDAC